MYFSRSTLIALISAPLLALAQTANPFNIPSAGLSAVAGHALDLSWKPTTSGTVSLLLRSGASNNLGSGTVIASHIQNSGSYSWSVPSSITRGSDYSVEIVSDSNSADTNYTPYFVIDSTNTVVSSGVPSSSLNTTTSTASSASGSMTSYTSSSSAASGSSSAAGSAKSTSSSGASTSGAPLQTASGNSAPRATAMAGMLGMVALGALAL